MVKIPLAEQIEAIGWALETEFRDGFRERLLAIRKTLEWMQANEPDIRAYIAHKRAVAEAKEHPAVKNVLEVFPGSQIEGVGEAD